MNFIKKILKENYEKKLKNYNLFIFAIIFILLVAALEKLRIEGVNAAIIMFAIIMIQIIIYIVIKKFLIAKFKFENTKLYKMLEKMGIKEEFLNTIDLEIKSKNSIKHYNRAHKTGLVITKTWFVFISSTNPKIRRTSEIYKITESVHTTNYTNHLSVEFKDNMYFNTNQIWYDDINEEIKEKFPDIYLE